MNNAFIVDGVRTPIGNFGGSLSPIRPDDMAALVIKKLMHKNPSVSPETIGDVMLGCANQAGEDNRNIARMAVLLADLPFTVPGETINRLCASGLCALMNGARSILCNDADFIIAGGVESMTRSPWVISKTSAPFGRDAQMFDTSFGWRFINPKLKEMYGTDSMGETAENLAEFYKVSRRDQDLFSFNSQQKATKARNRGRFSKEIVEVLLPTKKGDPILFKDDEFIKPSSTMEGLSLLKPAFRHNGSVTAGNSSGLNDGAAALLLASEKGLKTSQSNPLARIVSMGVAGVEPRFMGIGPVKAIQIALDKASLTLEKMDIIEINEAFAAQVLSVTRSLNISDDDERINPNGGAISLGHPLGMSGARIALSAAIELQEQKKQYALVSLCIGVGQGFAVVLERV